MKISSPMIKRILLATLLGFTTSSAQAESKTFGAPVKNTTFSEQTSLKGDYIVTQDARYTSSTNGYYSVSEKESALIDGQSLYGINISGMNTGIYAAFEGGGYYATATSLSLNNLKELSITNQMSGAITMYGTLNITGNEKINISNNTSTGWGSPYIIFAYRANISGNDSVSFINNASENNAIIQTEGYVDIKNNSGTVAFVGNTGSTAGAIYTTGHVDISSNQSDVLFLNNTHTSTWQMSAAIAASNGTTIADNAGDVVFAGNSRALAAANNSQIIDLIAKEDKSISIHDTSRFYKLNLGGDEAGNEYDGQGSVIFSGKAYDASAYDLGMIGGGTAEAPVQFDIMTSANLLKGSLIIEENAQVNVSGAFNSSAGTGLEVKDGGILVFKNNTQVNIAGNFNSAEGSELKVSNGATLNISSNAGNSIGGNAVFEEGSVINMRDISVSGNLVNESTIRGAEDGSVMTMEGGSLTTGSYSYADGDWNGSSGLENYTVKGEGDVFTTIKDSAVTGTQLAQKVADFKSDIGATGETGINVSTLLKNSTVSAASTSEVNSIGGLDVDGSTLSISEASAAASETVVLGSYNEAAGVDSKANLRINETAASTVSLNNVKASAEAGAATILASNTKLDLQGESSLAVSTGASLVVEKGAQVAASGDNNLSTIQLSGSLTNNGKIDAKVSALSGGLVSGSGSFNDVTIGSGAKLVVGNSPGHQEFASLTLDAGSTTVFSIGGNTAATDATTGGWASGTYSTVSIGGGTGTFTLGGTIELQFSLSYLMSGVAGETLTLTLDLMNFATGDVLATDLNAINVVSVGGRDGDKVLQLVDISEWTKEIVDNEDGTSTLRVSGSTQYVPEPSTVTFSLLALAGLAARRRRKA